MGRRRAPSPTYPCGSIRSVRSWRPHAPAWTSSQSLVPILWGCGPEDAALRRHAPPKRSCPISGHDPRDKSVSTAVYFGGHVDANVCGSRAAMATTPTISPTHHEQTRNRHATPENMIPRVFRGFLNDPDRSIQLSPITLARTTVMLSGPPASLALSMRRFAAV